MEFWIVGKYVQQQKSGAVWEFQGLFSSRALAIKNCINSQYFIAPAELDKLLPDESIEWPGVEYPIQG